MFKLTDEEFEAAVAEALDSIPEQFLDELENVVITVQDEPTEDQLELSEDPCAQVLDDEVLGLYEGVSLYDRGEWYGECNVPDVITIFKGPHERSFDTREEILEEIRKTVVHEIGHYFGMDEEAVWRMGY